MKTAMQLMVDRANLGIGAHESELCSSNISNIERNRHTYLLNVCKMFHGLAIELLEKEKQQHEKIAIDMVNIALNNLNNPNCKMEDEFNKYYSETYKKD